MANWKKGGGGAGQVVATSTGKKMAYNFSFSLVVPFQTLAHGSKTSGSKCVKN